MGQTERLGFTQAEKRCGWPTDVDFQSSQPLNWELMTLSWGCWINQEETVLPTDLLVAALVPAQKTGRKTKANEPNTISTGFRRCSWSMRGSALHHPLNQHTLQTFGYSSLKKNWFCEWKNWFCDYCEYFDFSTLKWTFQMKMKEMLSTRRKSYLGCSEKATVSSLFPYG